MSVRAEYAVGADGELELASRGGSGSACPAQVETLRQTKITECRKCLNTNRYGTFDANVTLILTRYSRGANMESHSPASEDKVW